MRALRNVLELFPGFFIKGFLLFQQFGMDTSSFIRVYLVGPTVTMMTSKEDKYRGDTVIRVAQHEKGPTSWQHHKLLTDKE